jgi:TRAP-type C4-dicarboxylate transport system permease small subunit
VSAIDTFTRGRNREITAWVGHALLLALVCFRLWRGWHGVCRLRRSRLSLTGEPRCWTDFAHLGALVGALLVGC